MHHACGLAAAFERAVSWWQYSTRHYSSSWLADLDLPFFFFLVFLGLLAAFSACSAASCACCCSCQQPSSESWTC